jgi:hypothetical protein
MTDSSKSQERSEKRKSFGRGLWIGLLIAVLLAAAAYRLVMPITPFWVDIAFIGFGLLFLLVLALFGKTRAGETKAIEPNRADPK